MSVFAVAKWCLAKTSIIRSYEGSDRRQNGPRSVRSGQI